MLLHIELFVFLLRVWPLTGGLALRALVKVVVVGQLYTVCQRARIDQSKTERASVAA